MEVVNMHEAKSNLSKLAKKVLDGERVFISKNNEPILELVPIKKKAKKSLYGVFKDQITYTDDCWAPDEEMIKLIDSSELYNQ